MDKPPDILSSEVREAMREFYSKFHNLSVLTDEQFAVIEYFRLRDKPLGWGKIAQFIETEFGVKMGGKTWCKQYEQEIIRRKEDEQA